MSSRFYTGGPLTGKTERLIAFCGDYPEPSRILLLSFYDAHVRYLRSVLENHPDPVTPRIMTVHHFTLWLLHTFAARVSLSAGAAPVSALARKMLIRQAWSTVGGALWRAHQRTPGATDEMIRVIDWLSSQRTGYDMEDGELADHEINRVYGAFIDLCRKHHILTFQEATLAALSLLRQPEVAEELARRFSTVVVDDLHLARPDQITLLETLMRVGISCVGTARLPSEPSDPGLRRVWSMINQADDPVTTLTQTPAAVNPALADIAERLFSTGESAPPLSGHPVTLITADTVEDETQAVTRMLADMLRADPSLRPEDMLVVCAESGLIRYMERHLDQTGIPFASAMPGTPNPYIQAGLGIVRWHTTGPRPEIVDALIHSPLLDIDALDVEAIRREARELDRLLREVGEADYPDALRNPNETAAGLRLVRRALASGGRPSSLSAWLRKTVESLDTGGLSRRFSEHTISSWRNAFDAWIEQIGSLETTAALVGLAARQTLQSIDRIEPLSPNLSDAPGIRLVDARNVEGLRCRAACVLGLSENATPRPDRPFQLIAETDMPGLFADGRDVTLPAIQDHAAWIDRETHRLATMLSRATEQLVLSTSRYSVAGNEQLPGPFFESLLGDEGEIDRNGRLRIQTPLRWNPVQASRASGLRIDLLFDHRKTGSLDTESASLVTDQHAAPERISASRFYSASQIRAYLRCPLQFFYERILHLDTDETPGMMRRGALLHLVVSLTLGDGRTQNVDLRDRPLPDWLRDADRLQRRAMAVLEAAWTGREAELPEGGRFTPAEPWDGHFGPKLQREAVLKWAARTLSRWVDFEAHGREEGARRRPILLEIPFSFQLDQYTMIGRIDRIDEVEIDGETVYEVIDYKTGSAGADSLPGQIRKFLPEKEEDGATDYQLPLYAMALGNGVDGLRAMPRMLTYINMDRIDRGVRGGFTAESARTVRLVDTPELDRKKGAVPLALLDGLLKDRMRSTLEAMSSGPYLPEPGFHCQFCGFRSACDRGQSQVRGDG